MCGRVTNSANKAVIEDVGFKKTYFAIGQEAIKATSNRQFTYTTSQSFTASGSGGNISAPAGGTGKVVQIGFETEINDKSFSVQRLDIFVKAGRVS